MKNLDYDPMADLYRQAIAFLFKQTPTIVLCLAACFVLRNEKNRRDNENKAEIARINTEWSGALNASREDWRQCESERQKLAVRVAVLETKINKR